MCHIFIGIAVLAVFWTAALAAKGSTLHRRGGRAYGAPPHGLSSNGVAFVPSVSAPCALQPRYRMIRR